MTANLVNLQVNQNTQVHPKDDPNIAFHHTFEALLPLNSKQVYIMEGRNVIFKIPIKAFWNSAQCSDKYYYTINTLDLENSTTSTEHVVRNPSLKTYSEDSNYFNSYEVIGDAAFRGTYGNVRSEPFIIKGKQIPELERNYRIKYHKEMQFPFVKANQANDCKVLTVQENEQSDRKFDLPSVACKHDNGRITCSKFGASCNILKPENSAMYYMTTTKDLSNNYKFYFSDKDGNKTNDLEFSLSDIRITEEALLKHLELDHNLKKLQTIAQTIETHLKNDTDSFEKGTAKTITSHLEKNAVQEKLANSLSQNTGFMQNVKDNAGPSPSAVAELLLESKELELGNAILHAIENNDSNTATVLSRLARDINLQTRVAENLKQDTNFQGRIKGKDGEAGPRGLPGAKGESPTPESVADELLHPSKDALINRLMFNEIVNPGGDITPKTLADRVKEKLAIDQTFPAEVAAKLFEQPVQLGRAVLSVKDADQKSELALELARDSTLKTDVKNLLKGDIEEDVGSLPRMARSIQEYEKQSQSSEKQIQKIEKDILDEEGRIFQLKEEAKAAADESERHAKRSEEAADLSEKHASDAGNHLAGAASSSRSAASFARNAKDASCRVAPEQQGCSSRTRREATWEESEDQTFQHENIELPYSLTNLDSVSFISI